MGGYVGSGLLIAGRALAQAAGWTALAGGTVVAAKKAADLSNEADETGGWIVPPPKFQTYHPTAVAGSKSPTAQDDAREAANAQARARLQAARQAGALPTAKAGTQAKARRKCKKCPPDQGAVVRRNWHMSPTSRAYQQRITGFAPYTEWRYASTDFDGFRSASCTLQEAKALYDQFFDADDQPTFFFSISGERKILRQARAQSGIVAVSEPALSHWHFMQPVSHEYFSRKFAERGFHITAFHTP